MTPEEIEDLEVQEINDLTQIATITGDENFPVQTPAGNNLACKAAQIAGYAFPATCNSAADAATKVVVITGYHGTVLPQLVAVTFTNGNTYGDVTASPATHPYIQFKNADNVNLGNAKSLCDCLGNYAGTGCLKAGNIAILRTLGDRALITNSDVRQQTNNMTIKADGNFVYTDVNTIVTAISTSQGSLFHSGNLTLPSLPAYFAQNVTHYDLRFNNVAIQADIGFVTFRLYAGYLRESSEYICTRTVWGKL